MNKINKKYLVDFETEVAKRYENGEIKAPIHLSGGNEEQLIEIFKNIHHTDWVFVAWRNHYHALLHGFDRDELMNEIVSGRSMETSSNVHNFYSSAISKNCLCEVTLKVAESVKIRFSI